MAAVEEKSLYHVHNATCVTTGQLLDAVEKGQPAAMLTDSNVRPADAFLTRFSLNTHDDKKGKYD
jgi:hypothetical protein